MEGIDEKLIEEVRKHGCLYDLGHPQYKNIAWKDKLWQKIAEEINSDVESTKKRWKSLRDMYRRNKRTQMLPSGSGASGKKHWKHFEALRFLGDVKSNRITIGNLQQDNTASEQPSPSPADQLENDWAPICQPRQPSPDDPDDPVTDLDQTLMPLETSYRKRKKQRQEKENVDFTNFMQTATEAINGLAKNFGSGKGVESHFQGMAQDIVDAELPPSVIHSVIENCRCYVYDAIATFGKQ